MSYLFVPSSDELWPGQGKVVVLAPATAARAAELMPECADRIYTLPDLPEGQAFVIDLDEIASLLPDAKLL